MPEVSRVIPQAWLTPGARVFRVILHWSAGTYTPNLIDRSHYHLMIAGDGTAVRGLARVGQYAPHVRGLNTGSVGIAACAMAGARQGVMDGRYPLTGLQVERMCQAAAEVVHAYRLALTERTCLTHSEVTDVYRITQRNRWDIDYLPYDPTRKAGDVHELLRRKVDWYLARLIA